MDTVTNPDAGPRGDLIDRLLAGTAPDPDNPGQMLPSVSTRNVVIADNLHGAEADLLRDLDLTGPFAVVSDPETHAVLGQRVERAVASLGEVNAIHLPRHPHANMATLTKLAGEITGARAIIAVGSGTINDLCKYAAARLSVPCAVFATAPSMNGYASVNAAITVDGQKKSLPAVAPLGVFMDLQVMAESPQRMIRAGLGDSVCRATAQADWLMFHLVRGPAYSRAPFDLLAQDEAGLLAEPEALLTGDLAAMRRLARTLVLSGMGMTICGGSYPASQGEHLISHYIEMMQSPTAPEIFHGEQIAVTTGVMARLQQRVLDGPPPRFAPSAPTEQSVSGLFGAETGPNCWADYQQKRLGAADIEQANAHIAAIWDDMCRQLAAILIAPARLDKVLQRGGVPARYQEIGLDRDFFLNAIVHAREIRNRYTFLDLAADSGCLDPSELT